MLQYIEQSLVKMALVAILTAWSATMVPEVAAQERSCPSESLADDIDEVRRVVRDLLYRDMRKKLIAVEHLHQCGALAPVSAYIDEGMWDKTALRTAILMVQTLHQQTIDVDDTHTLNAIKLLAFQTGKLRERQQQALIAYAARKLGRIEDTEALLALVPEAIPEFVHEQMAAVNSTVKRGPWNPPGGQAIPFYIGNEAHRAIAVHYRTAHLKELLFFNSTPISSILIRLAEMGIGPAENASAKAIGARAMRPDIVNLSTREIYEIKPAGAESVAAALVARHIETFARAGVAMSPGRTSARGTRGVVPGPAGHFMFYSPRPGVIVYSYKRGDYVPVPRLAEAPEQSKQLARVPAVRRARGYAMARPKPQKLGFWARMERATGLTGVGLGVYLIISEGSRVLFPPRNAIPVP